MRLNPSFTALFWRPAHSALTRVSAHHLPRDGPGPSTATAGSKRRTHKCGRAQCVLSGCAQFRVQRPIISVHAADEPALREPARATRSVAARRQGRGRNRLSIVTIAAFATAAAGFLRTPAPLAPLLKSYDIELLARFRSRRSMRAECAAQPRRRLRLSLPHSLRAAQARHHRRDAHWRWVPLLHARH